MAVTVAFTGTPLTGTDPLSVAFTLTATITPEVQGRGGEWTGKKKRRYSRPYYYYQQAYAETLKNVPEPADEKTFDATIEAAQEISRVIERLEKNDHDFTSMLRKFDAMQRNAVGFIKSQSVQRKIDETRDFIQAARDAEIARLAREEAEEREELKEIIGLMYGS